MTIAEAFIEACRAELAALKPGNVGLHGAGHGMRVADFQRSADAAAPELCRPGATLGVRVLSAVSATRAVVRQNTNLGILLLCAPLAMAAERGGDLRVALGGVLRDADLADAANVFAAIAHADPGGLGDAPAHDVRRAADVTLAVAMQIAAHRDSIARQYASDFADVFAAVSAWRGDPDWRATAIYLRAMATWPDSHIARKRGVAAARDIQEEAARYWTDFMEARNPETMRPALLAWDADLKARGFNPGTSADLTVATLFASCLPGAL